MVRVLGISASLRNARFKTGSASLVRELQELASEADLGTYLKAQTKLRLDDFVNAGRAANKPFNEIYANLRKLRGERGLSNSEAASATALWAAHKEGAEIAHVSLADHFPMSGKGRNLDALRNELIAADGIIVSGPVYFGDRGSLAQSLFEYIAADPELRDACRGKVYGGLAVGAKRNGGQETTLIYQMLDMVNLDLLAVGNSSDTTAQYGGTAVAGDVGKLHSDDYGIETCIGTGRRVARVARMLSHSREGGHASLREPVRVQLWLLQDDKDGTGLRLFQDWARQVSALEGDVEFKILDATKEEVVRCIACDICPVDTGPVDEYRCIITTKSDFFVSHHAEMLDADAILMCAYSSEDRGKLISVYQQFIERTRYLRRDNYALTDMLFAPFVISELAARQNLHMRMLTSGIRHHTVLHHPLIAMMQDGKILDTERLLRRSVAFVQSARELAIGRYLEGHPTDLVYKPVGYEVSALKARNDADSGKLRKSIDAAASAHAKEGRRRLKVG